MTTVPPKQLVKRSVGDTRTPLRVRLTQSGVAVDLTGKTVAFKMVTSTGGEKVAENAANVSVLDAATGDVQYQLQAADVDTAGTFYGWWLVYDGDGKRDTFPADGRTYAIEFYDDEP